MTIAERRGDRPCLPPVPVRDVVADPEAVRELARRTGPYAFPERPGGFIWPTWHARWAFQGKVLVDAAASLLEHQGFIDAAARMCGSDRVEAEGVYVNLGTPWMAQPVMHTDMPLFRGLDQEQVPGWFFQSMGTSRLFEAERLNSITAVAWFFEGEEGGFTCWPDGPEGLPLEQREMWNTAIVGDNDFMYHRVERIGPAGATRIEGMTAATTLDHDGHAWVVTEAGQELGRLDDREVRLSISWRATVLDDNDAETALDDVYERMAAAIGPGIAAAGPAELFDEPSRIQLMERWPGFLPAPSR